mgnify:CR=1 FL=1
MDKTTILGVAASARAKAEELATAVEALKGGMKYKGAVQSYAQLPQTGMKAGDVWTAKDTGTEYVWGSYEGTNQWIPIGPDHLTHETWTFELVSGETVEKEVVLWTSAT